jgi:peptide/nickel transport system substrate-binding protein
MASIAKRQVWLASGLGALLTLAACAPAVQRDATSRAEPPPTATKKVLSVGVLREPPALAWGLLGNPISAEEGLANVPHLIHNTLAVEWELASFRPQLATALPSIDDGTWRLNPDGTMDTVWRLQPNARWHDGTPFTSADLVFTYNIYTDPSYPNRGEARPLMESVSAPDPSTFIIHWKGAFVGGYKEPPGDEILPRHILEDLYRTADRNTVVNSPWFRSDFVGLGPYRLARWEEGSHIELARFDDYFMGRPAFDTILVRFIADANAMVANVLAGNLDVALPPVVSVEAALEVKRRWEGTGNQVVADPNGKLVMLDPQLRPDSAEPRNGFPNVLVRQAFYQALDRPGLAEVMTQGLAPIADSYYAPHDELRRDMEGWIPQFPYDPARGQQLLAQAGWRTGADGGLVFQATGERFQTEVRGGAGAGRERLLSVIADGWKTIGADTSIYIVPAAVAGDRELNAKRPGLNVTNPSAPAFTDRNRLHSSQIATSGNNWAGINTGGYASAPVDGLLDQLRATIDPHARLPLLQQLVKEQIGDVAVMPLYWEVSTVLMLKGVKGPKSVNNAATQNIFEWDRETT